MVDTKQRFTASSFVAPTAQDIAAFNALPDADKRALMAVELDKGFAGNATPWTPAHKAQIKARALQCLADKHAPKARVPRD